MLLALMLEDFLRGAGLRTLRAGRLADALALAREHAGRIDVAVLDINLGGEQVFPLADLLEAQGVPFLFATAYGRKGVPPGFAAHPALTKPYLGADVLQAVNDLVGPAG